MKTINVPTLDSLVPPKQEKKYHVCIILFAELQQIVNIINKNVSSNLIGDSLVAALGTRHHLWHLLLYIVYGIGKEVNSIALATLSWQKTSKVW